MRLTSIPRELPGYSSCEKKLMDVAWYRPIAATMTQNAYFTHRKLTHSRNARNGVPMSATLNT